MIGPKQVTEKYLKVAMGKIEHKAEKETLNKADFAVIKAYAKEHPEDDLPKSILKYINDNKDSIKRDIGFRYYVNTFQSKAV